MDTTTNALPLEQIAESPFNHRKTFDKDELAKLADSIKELGVLQPILVRPTMVGKLAGVAPYECVFGHRRLRAAKLAGLEKIPVTVRELDDKQALETQLVENCHRQDIHPLEEGAAYQELHAKLGYTIDEIAAKVGKSRETIYARMKLCSLCASARDALLDGRLTASVAVLIARIPHEKLQTEATKEILDGSPTDDEPMSFRYASSMLQRDFMLRLAEAPFDPKSAELLPDAGPCSSCPKRTGAQPELFGDVDHADVCTDTICYAAKRDAEWKRRTAEAKTTGVRVLSAKECKEVYQSTYDRNPGYKSGFVDLEHGEYINGKMVTVNQLAKKAGRELPVTLARDQNGGIHELVDQKAANALVRAANKSTRDPDATPSRYKESPEEKARNEKFKREQEERRLVDEKVTVEVLKSIENGKGADAAWLSVFECMLDSTYGIEETIGKRRGFDDGLDVGNELRTLFVDAVDERRLAILVELAIADRNAEPGLAKACGVDVKAITREVKAELKSKKKNEEKPNVSIVWGGNCPRSPTGPVCQ